MTQTMIRMVVCEECIINLEKSGQIPLDFYLCSCMRFVYKKCTKIHSEDTSQLPIVKHLEDKKYIVTIEHDEFLYVKPLGHFFDGYLHCFCIDKHIHSNNQKWL
jgi:hypothetical protein